MIPELYFHRDYRNHQPENADTCLSLYVRASVTVCVRVYPLDVLEVGDLELLKFGSCQLFFGMRIVMWKSFHIHQNTREGSEGGFKGSTEEENKNAAAGRSDWENGKDEESRLVFVKKTDVTFFECLTSNLLLQSSTFSESIIQSIIILSIFLFFIFLIFFSFPLCRRPHLWSSLRLLSTPVVVAKHGQFFHSWLSLIYLFRSI